MDSPLLPIIIFLLALAVLIVARRSRAATGLPEGDILYGDSGIGRDEAPLYSARHAHHNARCSCASCREVVRGPTQDAAQ